MRRHLVSLGSVFLVTTAPLLAQDGGAVTPAAALEGEGTTAPAAEAPRKKKGFFGKLKDVAGNKTVQQVAKVAACTVVPGGQVVAGAIDAASSASDGNAAGAAGGAAAAASGTSCFGGPAGGGVPAAGMGGMGSVAQVGGVATMAASAAAVAAMSSDRFGGAAPGATPGPDEGTQYMLTPKQEKEWIKQAKKAGMSEEQARQQLDLYKQQMASVSAAADTTD